MARILAIDDDDAFREYLSVVLERAGHTVRTRETGMDVASVVGSGAFDVVLTDLYMPGADGIEILRALRAVAPDLPVICISGRHREVDDPCLRIMRVLGATILPKPVQRQELLDAVDQCLARLRPSG